MNRLVIAALFTLLPALSHAQSGNERLPVPRFVSLRSDDVNLRAGPDGRYPIEWVFKRRNLPVEILAEFDTWRRIRDSSGTEGWVHQALLQGRRYAIVAGETRALRRTAQDDAAIVARLEPGVIGRLLECKESWCRLEAGGFRGWLKRQEIWGVYPQEVVR
jgi:SH3-like domain-containing protein